MKRVACALIAAGALSGGALVSPAAADPPPQACRGQIVSFAVQALGGRRAVAETFFTPGPHALQDAQAFLTTICPSGG